MSSALVTYYEYSPNPDTAGCMVTTMPEDGVVIHNIDTVTGEYCYVGRTVIYEAFAELTGLKPNQLDKLVDQAQEIKKLKATNKEQADSLAKWDSFSKKAEAAGLVIKALE